MDLWKITGWQWGQILVAIGAGSAVAYAAQRAPDRVLPIFVGSYALFLTYQLYGMFMPGRPDEEVAQ